MTGFSFWSELFL